MGSSPFTLVINKTVNLVKNNFCITNIPQADISIIVSIIFSLILVCTICYGILVIYIFYPFSSNIKVIYNLFNKAQHLKKILVKYF